MAESYPEGTETAVDNKWYTETTYVTSIRVAGSLLPIKRLIIVICSSLVSV